MRAEEPEELHAFLGQHSPSSYLPWNTGWGSTCRGRFATGCREKVIVIVVIIEEASRCWDVRAFSWRGPLVLLGLPQCRGRGGTKHISIPCGWKDRTDQLRATVGGLPDFTGRKKNSTTTRTCSSNSSTNINRTQQHASFTDTDRPTVGNQLITHTGKTQFLRE